MGYSEAERVLLRERAVRLYEEFQSGHKVSKTMGISGHLVYVLLKEAGVSLLDMKTKEGQDSKKALRGVEAEAAVREYREGVPLAEIMARYDVSNYAIYTAVRDAGGERRTRGAQSRSLTTEEVSEIVRLYRDEHLAKDHISAKLGIAYSKVRSVIQDADVSPMRSPRIPKVKKERVRKVVEKFHPVMDPTRRYPKCKYSFSDEEEIVRRYRDGESAVQLASFFELHQNTVLKILDFNGVKRRSGGAFTLFSEADHLEVIRRWNSGESATKIAQELGTSYVMVNRVLEENGHSPEIRRQKGENHYWWKGGRVLFGGGYVGIHIGKDHPYYVMATSNGYVLEHRLVVAEWLGRPLAEEETVHHKNGKKDDNRLENLNLRYGQHGQGIICRCRDCGSNDIEFLDSDSDTFVKEKRVKHS